MNSSEVPRWRNDAGLVGNSVVVTGAAGEIGSQVARALAEVGAKVLAVDRPDSDIAAVAKSLPGTGHDALGVELTELTSHAGIFARARELAGADGRYAALVHLAAVLVRRNDIDEVTEHDWDRQSDTNLKATFFLNRAAWRAFREQRTPGSIVNAVSQGWWTGGFGGSVVYAATKGGVVSLTRGLARSFAPDGVRVNAIAPGGVNTTMFHDGMTAASTQAFIEQIPAGRLGEPDDVVGPTIFLASSASAYMTGSILNISGGQLIY